MIKIHWTHSRLRWKDSITVSLAILTGIQTISEVIGLFGLEPIRNIPWWGKGLIIIALFVLLTLAVFVFKMIRAKRGITLCIGDNEVNIKQADIFKQDGLQLIPFNERFDTDVDDIIIAHNSLNGIFIDEYVGDDISILKQTIRDAPDVLGLSPKMKQGNNIFPLGRIIAYKNKYLLLSFTHFDKNNNAYLSHSDYEKCLLTMWQEINRVYANRPVYIPLLGSGITRFTDTPHKDNRSLISCVLCTLRMSGIHLKKPITICLTNEVMNDINIYELKSKQNGI